jgi:hypothetical protein
LEKQYQGTWGDGPYKLSRYTARPCRQPDEKSAKKTPTVSEVKKDYAWRKVAAQRRDDEDHSRCMKLVNGAREHGECQSMDIEVSLNGGVNEAE